jgi:hypothetical protein
LATTELKQDQVLMQKKEGSRTQTLVGIADSVISDKTTSDSIEHEKEQVMTTGTLIYRFCRKRKL